MVIEDSEGASIMKYLGLTPGMLGLCSAMLTIMSWQTTLIDSEFHFYRPRIQGDIQARNKGSLLAIADRPVMLFGMEGPQICGKMFCNPEDGVYKGMM
jgi:predicted membrane GTPase involved in stress response